MKPFVKIILGLGCAFGAGFMTAVWVRSSDRHGIGPISAAKHDGTRSAPTFSSGPLRSPRDRERSSVISAGSTSEEILEALFKKRPAEALSAEGTLGDDICEYLSITRVERAALDEAVRDARLELQAEQRKQLRREDAKDGVLKFTISSFPEKGTAEKEKLLTRIGATLGAERSLLFMRVGKESLKSSFLNFGASETSISIRPQTRGVANERVYETYISSGRSSRLFETPGIPQLLSGVIELE